MGPWGQRPCGGAGRDVGVCLRRLLRRRGRKARRRAAGLGGEGLLAASPRLRQRGPRGSARSEGEAGTVPPARAVGERRSLGRDGQTLEDPGVGRRPERVFGCISGTRPLHLPRTPRRPLRSSWPTRWRPEWRPGTTA